MSATDSGSAGPDRGEYPRVPGRESTGRSPLGDAEHAREAAEASRDRFAFLAEVSRCLADSLDYETTLTTVAGMSLPYLGAWCIVDVLDDSGEIRRLAVLHPDGAKQGLARELHERYPPRPDDLIGAPRVIRTRRAELVFDVPDEALAATAHDADHLALLRALGTKAYVIVPMVARGRTLGAITFITADGSRRFGDIDVVIAEDLARRAAMAVDNARLYRDAEEAREGAEAMAEEAEMAAEDARQAREEAEAALAARSQFVSMMSHELRTPVNAIMGYTQLMELGVAGPLTEQQRDYMARLGATSEHLRGLVDDVLDLARIDAGRADVARATAMTGELAAAALDLVRPQASARGIRLVDARPGDPGEFFVGDEHRVRQILVNLLSNAVKFTAPGGVVTLDCGQVDATPPATALQGRAPWTFVRVTDTGIGIPSEQLERVFEPFFQVQNARAQRADGTGLGLAISRQLARLMGGDLTVESAPDKGSAFTLWLPAAAAARIADEGDAGADRGARARKSPGVSARALGLAEVGARLRTQVEHVLAAIATRLRADPATPGATQLPRAELEDHMLSFLVDVAQTLVVIEETGGPESDVLRDGTTIQRVVSELHGAMRQRRGWTEAEIAREYEIVGEEIAAVVRRAAERSGDVALALDVLGRLVERGRDNGLASARRTAQNQDIRDG